MPTREPKENLRKRIFEIIQIGKQTDIPSRLFDIGIVCTIAANILMMLLETFDQLAPWFPLFQKIEIVTLVIFCVEYVLRIWTADLLYPDRTRIRAILRFLVSFDGVVNLLTILPFFLSGFVVFRMLRVVRIFRLFRVNAIYDSFHVILTVLNRKRNQIVSSVFILLILMLAAGMCMYSAEHTAQPEVFQNAFSGIWWSVSALLTVGYGDIYPITVVGQVSAIILSLLGVGVVAIPTGIISAGFYEQYAKAQETPGNMELNAELLEVGIDSRWLDMTPREILRMDEVVILLAERENAVLTPNERYTVQIGDVLHLYRLPQST